MPRPRGLIAFAALLMAASTVIVLARPPIAQSAGALSVVSPTDQPATVALTPITGSPTNRGGELAVVLNNNSSYARALTVQLTLTPSAAIVPLGTAASYPATGVALFSANGQPITLAPFTTTAFVLAFGTADATRTAPISGTLSFAAEPGEQVQAATLRVQLVAGAQWSDIQVEPAKVVILATRLLPAGPWDYLFGSPRGTVHFKSTSSGDSAAAVAARAGEAESTARLGGDRGGSVAVALTDVRVRNDGTVSGSVSVSDVGKAGKYDGALTLGSTSRTPRTVTVTVNAQDVVIWPIAAVLLGATIAGVMMWRRETKRSKDLLRSALKSAANTYAEALRKLGGDAAVANAPYNLDDLLPRGSAAGTWPDAAHAANTTAEVRYAQIESLKTQEELDKARDQAAELTSMVTVWLKIAEAAGTLRDAAVAVEDLQPESPPLGDQPSSRTIPILVATNQLLSPATAPADSRSAQLYLEQLQQQAKALGIWRQAWTSYTTALALYEELVASAESSMSPEERLLLHAADPRAICAVHLWSARSWEDLHQREPLQRLWDANRTLLALTNQYSTQTEALLSIGAVFSIAGTAAGAAAAPARVTLDTRTPAEILAEVRRLDVWDFVISAAITVVAFVLTIYPDKNFGAPWQYVAAIVAGAAGQVAIAWKLLPWFRSYTGTKRATSS